MGTYKGISVSRMRELTREYLLGDEEE